MAHSISVIPTDKWHPVFGSGASLGRSPDESFPLIDKDFNYTPIKQESVLGCVVNAVSAVKQKPDWRYQVEVVDFVPNCTFAGKAMIYPSDNFNMRGDAMLPSDRVEHIFPLYQASIGAFKYLAHTEPKFARSIDRLKLFALRMFPGSSVSSTLYTDPEEGWQKLVFEVDIPQNEKINAFELEERFIDAVCDSGEYGAVLRKIILRVC